MEHRRRSEEEEGSSVNPQSSPGTNKILLITVCVLLTALVWIVFGQTLRHEFINYDDDEYVYENPRIASGLTLNGVHWAIGGVHSNNWHPLTTISHMLDCELYGLEPWGHHRTNVWLHAVAAIFLFLAFRRLTETLWPSAIVAALFAIHPLHVQSVAWVAERKDVLSGVFFALTIWAYARFVRSEQGSAIKYLAVIIFFVLGLMCKPTLVTIPFVLLLLDYWPLQRLSTEEGTRFSQWTYLFLEKVPLFVFAIASGVVTIMAQGRTLVSLGTLTFLQRLGNAAVSYLIYLGQTFWPTRLSPIYPYPDHLNVGLIIFGAFLLVGLSVAFFLCRKRYPFLLIGWLWFLGMLVPMIGIIQVGPQPHADRYLYLPQIGIFLLCVWSLVTLQEKWPWLRHVTPAIAGVVVGGLALVSYKETSSWKNSEILWRHALANTTKNQIAENDLGNALVRQNRLDEALPHFRNALQIYPRYPEANNNLGYVLASQGNWSDAIEYYQRALELRPDFPTAQHNLAVALAKLGRIDEAIDHFREALRLDPTNAEAHYNLGNAFLEHGQVNEAAAQFQEAMRLKPNDLELRARILGNSKSE